MAENKHLTPVWIVYVDGKRLDTEHEGALLNINVTDMVNGISTCLLTFNTSAVDLRTKGTFALESKITIHLGYKDDCAEVFNGEITAFHTVLKENGGDILEVKGANVLHKFVKKCLNSRLAIHAYQLLLLPIGQFRSYFSTIYSQLLNLP